MPVHLFSGEIQERGVVLPFSPVVYKSLLSRLRADGIHAKETTTPLNWTLKVFSYLCPDTAQKSLWWSAVEFWGIDITNVFNLIL